MRYNWGKTRIKGFAEQVPTAERKHWFYRLTEYLPALVMIVCIVVTIWIWIKIFQLWAIHRWLESF